MRHLGRFIDEGELDTLLTQPKPVLLHALGMRSQPSGFGDIAVRRRLHRVVRPGLVADARRSSSPPIVASAIVFVASGIVFFSLAFWLGRVETLSRQLWDLLITFSLYPEPLFGGALRLVLFTVLPAGFVGYIPARVVHAPTLLDLTMLTMGDGGVLVTCAAGLRARPAAVCFRQPIHHIRVRQ